MELIRIPVGSKTQTEIFFPTNTARNLNFGAEQKCVSVKGRAYREYGKEVCYDVRQGGLITVWDKEV